MSEWILLGIGLLLTIGTGLFVASEFALVNLDRADLEARRARGETRLGAHDLGAQDHLDAPVERAARHHADDAAHRLHDGAGDQRRCSPARSPRSGLPEAAGAPVGAIDGDRRRDAALDDHRRTRAEELRARAAAATAKVVIPFQAAFTWVFRPGVALLNGSANVMLRAIGIEPKEELLGRALRRGALVARAPLGERRAARAGHRDAARRAPCASPTTTHPTS